MPGRKVTPRKISAKKIISKSVSRNAAKEALPEKMALSNKNLSAKNPRLWVGIVVVALVVLAFIYKGLFVAALVNGQPISRISVIQSLEQQSGKQALSTLISQSLIFQEAQKRHIIVSDQDVNVDIKKIEDSLKSQGATLDQALAARGLSKTDLVQQIKLQRLLNKMVGASVKVTDDDVAAYIDKNQGSLPKDLSDADLKAQVRQQLEQQQLQDKTQVFVADLQKKAKINYFVNY